MESGVDLLARSLTPVISTYGKIMGGEPSGKLAILASVAPLADGGEAFKRSISLMLRQAPDSSTKGRWAYLLCHEIFHLWNGSTITPANAGDVEWFVEGFTDYMAKLVAFRTNLITQEDLLNQISISYDRYVAGASKGVSMKSAGAAKAANFPLLYYGGMATAIALDVESRAQNPKKGGFPNLMRAMYSAFGKTHRTYTYKDIVRIAGEVAGSDQARFFREHVEGRTLIPLDVYLARAGLTLTSANGKTVISMALHPTLSQARLLDEILNR